MLIRKDEWERKIFMDFAAAVGLDLDSGSITSGTPPQPDVQFTIGGAERWAELVEITDQDLAKGHMTSLKTGAITGGFFSQSVPLERSVRGKAKKTCDTNGSPLDLLAYYDKEFPAIDVEPDLIPQTIGHVAASMVESGVWTRVWVYDNWSKRILWSFPELKQLPSL